MLVSSCLWELVTANAVDLLTEMYDGQNHTHIWKESQTINMDMYNKCYPSTFRYMYKRWHTSSHQLNHLLTYNSCDLVYVVLSQQS